MERERRISPGGEEQIAAEGRLVSRYLDRLTDERMRQTTFGYLAMLEDIRRQLDVTPAVLRG